MNLTLVSHILAWTCLAIAVPGTIYLLVLTIAGLLPRRTRHSSPLTGHLAVVVPAHNEARGIEPTLLNLCAEASRDGATEIVVVADNCSDDTAEVAKAHGVRVIVRDNTAELGKGYALNHAFEELQGYNHVAYVVIDADSRVDPGFLAVVRNHLGAGSMAIQARYQVLNGTQNPRTQLAELAFGAWNVLRPRGRDRLGLSVGLLGNGFALHRSTVKAVPYKSVSLVEDFEYHLALMDAGISVCFADDATVRAEMPPNSEAAATQHARWEGGRLQMLLRNGVHLAARILRGERRYIDPMGDLVLPPLAYLVSLIIGGLLCAFLAGDNIAIAIAMFLLTVIGIHVVAAIAIAALPWRYLCLIIRVPGYVIWKLRHIDALLKSARRNAPWVRTARSPSSEGASS